MAKEIIEASKTFFGSRTGLKKRVGEDINERLLKGTKGLYAKGSVPGFADTGSAIVKKQASVWHRNQATLPY